MADEAPRIPHPADPLLVDIEQVYRAAQARLELLVQDAIRRGLDPLRAGTPDAQRGDALAAYRLRQLQRINAELDALARRFAQDARALPTASYVAGAAAIDPTPARALLAQAPHARAVAALVGNLTAGLQRAVATTRSNVAELFQLASQLGGGATMDARALAGMTFLGRPVDDAYREATLRSIAEGLTAGDTRRDISGALERRLVRDGTANALKGYTDTAGRRWDLQAYARMAVRTTTREAMTAGTVGRMADAGLDLVTISTHKHPSHDACTPWAGRTGSLTGRTPGYEVIELPPYHPNCKHVAGPASQNLDDYEARLRAEVAKLKRV